MLVVCGRFCLHFLKDLAMSYKYFFYYVMNECMPNDIHFVLYFLSSLSCSNMTHEWKSLFIWPVPWQLLVLCR